MLGAGGWGERGGGSLRSALRRLRRLKDGLLDVSSTYLCVKPCIAIDFVDAGARAHRLLTRDGAFEDDDYDAMAPERELLPDVYDEWAVIEREGFRQLRLNRLVARWDRLAAAGRVRIWLVMEAEGEHRFRGGLSATRGLDPAPYARSEAGDVNQVCEIVRNWLQDELAPHRDNSE